MARPKDVEVAATTRRILATTRRIVVTKGICEPSAGTPPK
jgi:hypothetical protein